jgi:hypothetical protein
MANRTLLGLFQGVYRLRISMPGYDVMNAGLGSEQLAFDSAWGRLGKVWMKGAVAVGSPGSVNVFFGRTFNAPPLVIVYSTMNWMYDSPGFKSVSTIDGITTTQTYMNLRVPANTIAQTYYYFVMES